jgi:hypothetical protein
VNPIFRISAARASGAAALSLAMIASMASATPFWSEADFEAHRESTPTSERLEVPPTAPRGAADYLTEFGLISDFLEVWQVSIPGADFGGIREGEHLPNIIQTDNTSEAIWVWSRYHELTGDDQYDQNIQDAWQYSMSHPAYLEEGGSTPLAGYYRMYNCGWAVMAEQKYREVYGDDTFQAYGDSCASYIYYHTLTRPGAGFYHYVNPPVLSWAVGNLHQAGVARDRADWRAQALVEGRKVKEWVEGEPTLLGNETWAMAGGATIWGLLNSFFQERPDSVSVWLPLYEAQLDEFSDPGDFQTAWNGWYALGHRAVGLALDDPDHLGTHVALTDYLVSEDADSDGGLPANPADTDLMDQTWVSNYLACFGLSHVMGPTSGVDVGQVSRGEILLVPNPSHDRTSIRFQLNDVSQITVTIHDVTGRCVVRFPEQWMSAGANAIEWDGLMDEGGTAPAGLYFASIRTPEKTLQQRLVRLVR